MSPPPTLVTCSEAASDQGLREWLAFPAEQKMWEGRVGGGQGVLPAPTVAIALS